MPTRRRPDSGFLDFVLDQLSSLPGVESRAMFGGHGIYGGGTFFAIAYRGRLFFRVDDGSRPEYVARGMKPFRPGANMTMGSYYEVPADVLEDARELVRWARVSVKASADRAALRRTPKVRTPRVAPRARSASPPERSAPRSSPPGHSRSTRRSSRGGRGR